MIKGYLRHAVNHLKSTPVLKDGYSISRGVYREIRYRYGDPGKALAGFQDKPPEKMCLEATNICNANCIFCSYQHDTRIKGMMSEDLFQHALAQYETLGGQVLDFNPLIGEPFLSPDIVPRISYAIRSGFQVPYCYTNGISLEDHDLESLLKSGVEAIFISTCGFEKEEYVKIYRNSHYDKFLRSVKKILELNDALGRPVSIKIKLYSNSRFEKILSRKDFLTHVKPYVSVSDLIYMVDYDNWGGLIKKSDLLPGMRLASVPKCKKSPCINIFSCMVMFDGKVRTCGMRTNGSESCDPFVIGDLNSDSLESIWYGKTNQALRESFLEGNCPDVCKKCSMYEPIGRA